MEGKVILNHQPPPPINENNYEYFRNLVPEGVKLGNYEDASQRDIVVMAIPMVIFHLVSNEDTLEFRMSVCRYA